MPAREGRSGRNKQPHTSGLSSKSASLSAPSRWEGRGPALILEPQAPPLRTLEHRLAGEEWRDQAEAQHRAGCNLSAGRAGWFRAGERRPVSVTSSIRLLGRKLTVEGVVVSEGPSGRESHSPSPDPWFLASKAPLVGE